MESIRKYVISTLLHFPEFPAISRKANLFPFTKAKRVVLYKVKKRKHLSRVLFCIEKQGVRI